MARKNNEREIPVIAEGDILKEALSERGMMQIDLADKLGALQSAVSQNINRKQMRIKTFCTMLDAMDFDVAVVDRKSGEVMWKVAVK